MAKRVMRIRNGMRLIEATLVGHEPPSILSRTYTVKREGIREPLFVGSNLVDAQAAFQSAVRQYATRPTASMLAVDSWSEDEEDVARD